ncbi:hypothetical protein JZ751_015565, partial [Albula glossodonta]
MLCVFRTGGWTGWGRWTECSSECGGGVQTRARACHAAPEESYLCEGVLEEGRPCNPQPCIGKVRHLSRSQSLRSVDSRKRDDGDKPRYGHLAPQTVECSGYGQITVLLLHPKRKKNLSSKHGIPIPVYTLKKAAVDPCMLTDLYPSPHFLLLLPLLHLFLPHPPPCPGPRSPPPLSPGLPTLPPALESSSGEEWSPWSVCSATCGEGWQSRTRFCISSSYSTQCSGPLREQRPCNNSAVCPALPLRPPVDGIWNEWSSWSSCSASCSNGTMQRTRECNGPSYGGSECRGEWLETRDCFLRDCPVDGKWQAWSMWGGCSKTCGGGSQQRQRVCYGPFFGGEQCPGDREEVRRCNEKRCPEPHEICDEENFANVVWKETPAGDTAAVRCPPNAVGLILRRCTLDYDGIAYWENPTYMKCISNDYRSIQTLTREHLSKAQRGLMGDGVSEVLAKLKSTSSDGTSYSGDLLAIVDVLKNMTEIFRRSYYNPSSTDVQNFVQSVSNLLMEENRERWEETQLGREQGPDEAERASPSGASRDSPGGMPEDTEDDAVGGEREMEKEMHTPPTLGAACCISLRPRVTRCPRGSLGPNIKELFRLIEDFVDVIGFRMKDFQDTYEVTENLVLSIHKRPASGASDITFPMKGWKGIDWAKGSEDKVTVSRNTLSMGKPAQWPPGLSCVPGGRCVEDWGGGGGDHRFCPQPAIFSKPDADDSSVFVTGIALYRNLGSILSLQRNSTVVNSKVVSVTIKPTPNFLSAPVEIEFSHLYNGTTNQTCISWDESDSDAECGKLKVSLSAAGSPRERSGDGQENGEGAHFGKRERCIARPTHSMGPLGWSPGVTIRSRMDKTLLPSVTLIVGCGVSSLTLLLLIIIYVSVWRSVPASSLPPPPPIRVPRSVPASSLPPPPPIRVPSWHLDLEQTPGSHGQTSTQPYGPPESAGYIRSERSVILINFCLSIISSNALILIGQTQTRNKVVCTLVAAFLHFFFLSSFCWVLTEAWQSYMAVTGRLRNRIIRKRFLCLGWGLPALIVAVSVGFTKAKGYSTVNYCWLSLEGGLLYAFVGPAAAVVLVNMVIGILVFNKLVSKDGITDMKLKERAGASLWSSCVVLPLLALTWMSAVLAITDRRSALFQILFAVFDSLEGFVIVMVHCILRREVQEAVKCRVVDRQEDGNGDSGSSFQNGHAQLMTDFEKDVDMACRSGECLSVCVCVYVRTLKRSSLQGEEKMPVQQLTLQKGSNFNTLPASMTKVHLQNVADYSSHTLTLKREKPSGGAGGELPGGKSIYICDGELFKQLDADLTRGQAEAGAPDGSSYVLLPNNTSTLRGKPKDDPAKYNISIEQLPQTRLIHLSNPVGDPIPGFGLKTLPADRVSVSCSERDSPIQNVQNISSESQMTNSMCEAGDSGNSGMMSKSETVSTLSMSSLE